MNPSRQYIASLTATERKELAAKANTTHIYLFQIGNSTRTPSNEKAIALEVASDKRIRASDFLDELRETVAPAAQR